MKVAQPTPLTLRTPSPLSDDHQRAPATSAAPPSVTEQPLLLQFWGCPYCVGVMAALALKQVSIPRVDVDLNHKPSWLTQFSPQGKVPAITYIEKGKPTVLYESLPLMQWVEEFYSQQGPSLMPESATDRAKARIIMSRFDQCVPHHWYAALRSHDFDEFAEELTKLRQELSFLEEHTYLEGEEEEEDPASGGFLLGSQPGLVDAVVGSWLVRAPLFKHYKNVNVLAKHPRLEAYGERFRSLPEMQALFQPPGGGSWEQWVSAMCEVYVPFAKHQVDFSAVDDGA